MTDAGNGAGTRRGAVMEAERSHTGSAVVTFLVHAFLWPVVLAVLVYLAAAGKLWLDKGQAAALGLLNLKGVTAVILGLYPLAVIPAAVIGLILAVVVFRSGGFSRKQTTLATVLVIAAALVAVYLLRREIIPKDLAQDYIEAGLYAVIGGILASLVCRGLLRLTGAVGS